ncbi:MAG: hypothetical protein GY720_18860, partial [bacterium]|nr:hypothetical protein [bacterium]
MAIDDGDLRALAGSNVGPVGFTEGDGAVIGTMDGRSTSLAFEAGTIRAESVLDVDWPQGPAATAGAVDAVLTRTALSRPELVAIKGDPAGTLTTTLWIDASSAVPIDVANAVKTVVFIADAARTTVEAFGLFAEEMPSTPPPVDEPEFAAAAAAPVPEPPVAAAEPEFTAPAPAAPPPRVERTPVYVDESVDVYDIETHVISWRMEPGQWYQLVEVQGEWTHVYDPADAREGWAPTEDVKSQDG